MKLWHLTPDAPCIPERVLPGDRVALMIGTWPIEAGQDIRVSCRADLGGRRESGQIEASWIEHAGVDSYWRAELGPFAAGTLVRYAVHGLSSRSIPVFISRSISRRCFSSSSGIIPIPIPIPIPILFLLRRV